MGPRNFSTLTTLQSTITACAGPYIPVAVTRQLHSPLTKQSKQTSPLVPLSDELLTNTVVVQLVQPPRELQNITSCLVLTYCRKNMTSSTNRKYLTAQFHQWQTKPRATCTNNLVKSDYELCEWTDKRTDRQTYSSQYFVPLPGVKWRWPTKWDNGSLLPILKEHTKLTK